LNQGHFFVRGFYFPCAASEKQKPPLAPKNKTALFWQLRNIFGDFCRVFELPLVQNRQKRKEIQKQQKDVCFVMSPDLFAGRVLEPPLLRKEHRKNAINKKYKEVMRQANDKRTSLLSYFC
jgi:hypothetical protein